MSKSKDKGKENNLKYFSKNGIEYYVLNRKYKWVRGKRFIRTEHSRKVNRVARGIKS